MNMRAQRQPGLRQWLEEKIESGKYKNLTWEDRDNLEFSIPWRHASSREWSQNEDAALFRDWAIYKKKFKKGKKGEKPDARRWKSNFRCALHQSQDIYRCKEKEEPKRDSKFSRVYRFRRLSEGETGAASSSMKSTPSIHIVNKTEDACFVNQYETEVKYRQRESPVPISSTLAKSYPSCTSEKIISNIEQRKDYAQSTLSIDGNPQNSWNREDQVKYFNSLMGRNVNNCLETPAQQSLSGGSDNRNRGYRLMNAFTNSKIDSQFSDDGHSNSDYSINENHIPDDDSDLSFELTDSDSIGSAISNASDQFEKIECAGNFPNERAHVQMSCCSNRINNNNNIWKEGMSGNSSFNATGDMSVSQDEDLAIYLNDCEPEAGELDENNINLWSFLELNGKSGFSYLRYLQDNTK